MSVIARFGGGEPPVFHFGEFTLDGKSRQLLRGGVRQHLSPKALQLLSLLLTAWPNALSREKIYDALWPEIFVAETNMAGVVSELRRILGDDARAAQYIRTVHGFGYVFCGDVSRGTSSPCLYSLVCGDRTFLLVEGENWVGRAPDCAVVLADRTISRRHAVVIVRGQVVAIEDRGSKNGVYVDGKKIVSCDVTPRSRIMFGGVAVSLCPRKQSSTAGLRVSPVQLRRRLT